MIVYTQTVFSALLAAHFVLGQNLNCTTLTLICPTAAQWTEREKVFNCLGNMRYVCLMASETILREGCIFNSTIPAGRVGCPYTNQCDIRTGQPLLVTKNNYLPCPPDLNGCPPHNHSGYSILEIYKYPRCQGKDISDESSVSPNNTTGTITTVRPVRIRGVGNWTINIICIIIGVILLLVTALVIICRGEIEDRLKKRSNQPAETMVNCKSNANLDAQSDVSIKENDLSKKPVYSINGNEIPSTNTLESTAMETADLPKIYRIPSQTSSIKVDVQDHPPESFDITEENEIPSTYTQESAAKERANLRQTWRTKIYRIPLQTSSSKATIKVDGQDHPPESLKITDSDVDFVDNNKSCDLNTEDVNPFIVESSNNIAGKEKRENNFITEYFTSTRTLQNTEQLPFSASPFLKLKPSELNSLPDVKIENEPRHVFTPTETTVPENKHLADVLYTRPNSCSSSDSDRSQTPMLKETSSSRKRNSPLSSRKSTVTNLSDDRSRTHISKGSSVCNKLPDTKYMEKGLRNVRRMRENWERAEKYSKMSSSEYVKVLEKTLQDYHQENKTLRNIVKLSGVKYP